MVEVYCGDCRDLVPGLGLFDFIFADPPFNIGQSYVGSCHFAGRMELRLWKLGLVEVEGVGFRASGRHLSMTLSFATPKNRFSKLLLSADGRELSFRGEDGVAVVEVGVC